MDSGEKDWVDEEKANPTHLACGFGVAAVRIGKVHDERIEAVMIKNHATITSNSMTDIFTELKLPHSLLI